MKIAIVGAGFSGLATAWFLLQKKCKVTLFDPKGIGGGASGIAAGLMHPFAGAHAKLNWMGREGYQATLDLLKIASDAMGEPVFNKTGLLRIATTEQQQLDFRQTALHHHDVQLLSKEQVVSQYPYIHPAEAIFIENALTIDTRKYLKGLWCACEALGSKLELTLVNSLSQLDIFDAIVVATGAHATQFPELKALPITAIKGQILELDWPQSLPKPPLPLNSQVYLLNSVLGATYERGEQDLSPNLSKAKSELLPKLATMVPFADDLSIVGCKAGFRASTPDHKPISSHVKDKIWVITGMGSKGLLYHAFYANYLTEQMLKA